MDESRLHPETAELWNDYLNAEKERVRGEVLLALDRFIAALHGHAEPIWHDWAIDLARDIVDRHREIPVRFRLFQQVLLPALSRGVIEERPGCARWLAHFETLLAKCEGAGLPANMSTAHALLKEAIRVDPADATARKMIVERTASYFEYTLHELPAGVLYRHDGATIAECDELIILLDEFRVHVCSLGEQARYSGLIADCTRHYHAYRVYLSLC